MVLLSTQMPDVPLGEVEATERLNNRFFASY